MPDWKNMLNLLAAGSTKKDQKTEAGFTRDKEKIENLLKNPEENKEEIEKRFGSYGRDISQKLIRAQKAKINEEYNPLLVELRDLVYICKIYESSEKKIRIC